MKIIDMKEEFIVADHVVTVQFENHYKAVTVYASDNHFHSFMFDSEEHAKDCLRKLKSFLCSTNSMENIFSVEEQPGYIEPPKPFEIQTNIEF